MVFFLQQKHTASNPRGYIALFSVIVLGAIGTAITVSLLLSGIGASQTGLVLAEKTQARMTATSCAEEVLQQILDTGIDTGTGSMSIGSSTCTYTIISTGIESMLVQVEGIQGKAHSKMSVVVASSTPRIKLSSWQEVSGF
ncbi:MAG: hypothetical protein RLZZ308_609 [Candidatus Parcubacteria bacterium]|jgi:hypothetical protein